MFDTYPFYAGSTSFVGSITSASDWKYLKLTDSLPGVIPGRLRIADYNADSYPDIALTIDF